MNKNPTSKSAFFNPRVLIGLAFCAIGLLLALFAFALYPGGNALAQRPAQDQPSVPGYQQQDETALELPEIEGTGTRDIIMSQGVGSEIQPNDTFDTETPFVSSCVVTALPNNGGLSGNERAPNTNFSFGRAVYLITA